MFYCKNKGTWGGDHVAAIGPIFLVFAVILAGCVDELKTTHVYYPIDSLITAQTEILTDNNAVIEKTAYMEGEKSESTFTPSDSAAWASELDIFRHLNVINKPVHRDEYEVSVSRARDSNLMVKSFTATEELIPVRYMKIYYLEHLDQIKRIEAQLTERNIMFTGVRDLVLEFREIDRRPYIAEYAIRGGQKMLLGDTVQYSINGRIKLSTGSHGEAQQER